MEEARRLNLKLRVVKTGGDVVIAVQRDDLDLATDARAKQLALADNRVGELDLEWDLDMLKRLHAEGLGLSPFWSAEELATLLAAPTTGLTDENSVVAPAETDIVRAAGLGFVFRFRQDCRADVDRVLSRVLELLACASLPHDEGHEGGRPREIVVLPGEIFAGAFKPIDAHALPKSVVRFLTTPSDGLSSDVDFLATEKTPIPRGLAQ